MSIWIFAKKHWKTLAAFLLGIGVCKIASPSAMPTWESIKAICGYAHDLLEAISFITTFLIAWFAWKALHQIEVTRSIAKTQASREAITMAAEKTVSFTEDVIPLLEIFGEAMSKGEYPVLKQSTVEEDLPNQFRFKAKNPEQLLQEASSHDALKLCSTA